MIDTNSTEVDKEEDQQTEEETYEDLQEGNTKPTISILEKKRHNETMECPNCQCRMKANTDITTNAPSSHSLNKQLRNLQRLEQHKTLQVQELMPNQNPPCLNYS